MRDGKKLRVLVTGASGLLGINLLETLKNRFQVVGTTNRHRLRFRDVHTEALDVTRRTEVKALVARVVPDFVVHCAAQTNVDYCERHPSAAWRTNVQGTRNVAEAVRGTGARLLFVSSDSVFDGRQGMYTERSRPHPLNVYGRTKLDGEGLVKDVLDEYLIVRTNFYGWSPKTRPSLAEWILTRLERGLPVPGFADISFTPMLVNDFCEVLGELMSKNAKGLLHVAGRERISKYGFAVSVARAFGRDETLVVESSSTGASLEAPRPRDTSLDVRRITHLLGRRMPSLAEGLSKFRELRDAGYPASLLKH